MAQTKGKPGARRVDRFPEYTPEEERRIVEHWDAGLSASLVAAAINEEFKTGRSRNAIIGKSKRLGCVGRPSPIQVGRNMGGSGRYRARKKRKAAAAILSLEDIQPDDSTGDTTLGLSAPRSSKQCQFIFGDVPRYPAEPNWCRKNSEPGQPYCWDHWRLTRTAVPKRKPVGSRNVFNASPLRRKYSP